MMFQFQMDRFDRIEPLLPRMSNVVKTYVTALAKLIDCPIDATLEGIALANAGCIRMPFAELAITGTSCGLPLLQTEADRISRLLDADMLILRCEARRGISLDVRLSCNDHWLGGYLLWMGNAELWLVPADPALPLLEIAGGLFERKFAPFADDAGRAAGLDKAYRALADLARRSV